MKTVSPELYTKRDFAGLLQLLTECREAARKEDHYKVASISLEVKHLDPLAVLESIYEADELHFYMEHPAGDEAIAGAEAVLQETFSGPERFHKVHQFSREVLDHTIAVGDLQVPFCGPHFFTAFTFYDEVDDEPPFPAATVFLPRWQVSRQEAGYGAVANIAVYPDSDLNRIAEKTWAAHCKFTAFDYTQIDPGRSCDLSGEFQIREVGGSGAFRRSVEKAGEDIAAGRYEKIVIAKCLELTGSRRLRPLESLNILRNRYPSCYAFSFAGGSGQSFIGATPERLLRVTGEAALTEALAGSASRGATAASDAGFAQALLESSKNNHEHRLVVDSIVGRLNSIGIEAEPTPKPNLLQLSNVQHLRTPIKARKPENTHLLDILSVLHPTPAVGGVPRETALPEIRRIEPFSRGLYAGALGWFNYEGEGEMVVAIRSALIRGATARVYAGNGIVDDSKPEEETAEADMKLQALLKALQ